MPFVWDSVTGLAHLATLFPGVTLERRTWARRYDDPEQLKEETVIHLPRSIDLSRLRLYAPWIRTLEALELPHRLYRFEGDFSILRDSAPKSGLLPNLQHLSFTDTCETVNQDHVNWLSVLLCPTLRSVRMLSWYPYKRLWLDFDRFPDALSDLMQKCPGLEVLEVFLRKSVRGNPGIYTPFGGPRTSGQLAHSTVLSQPMPYCQGLRQLTGSAAFLQPDILSFLGSLPSLESVILYGSAPRVSTIQPHLECKIAFPALKHLELRHLDARLTVNLCSLEPLVSSLTSAVIKFPFLQKHDWNFGDCDPPQATISALSLLSPQLTDLTIALQSGPYTVTLNPPMIESFQRLPLRSLRLSAVSLAPGISWNNVLAALPRVRVLRLCCSIEFRDLEVFSLSLPELHHLELRFIDFGPMQDTRDTVHQGISAPNDTSICLEGELYMANFSTSALYEVASLFFNKLTERTTLEQIKVLKQHMAGGCMRESYMGYPVQYPDCKGIERPYFGASKVYIRKRVFSAEFNYDVTQ
ncbi:hypothetical protein FRC10_010849 [Ceratobasidium sp. 414]|nr:hypothetical protein FRC10_010849 [Ceratobasidium sp. 414]